MFYEFLDYLKSDKKSIRSMLVFATVSSVLILAIPFLIQTLIQQYTLLVFQQSTIFLILCVGLFLAGITIMRVLQMHLSEYLQRRLFLNAIQDARQTAQNAKDKNQVMDKKKWNYIFESISLQKSLIPLFFDGFTFVLQALLVLILISIYHPFFVIYSLGLMMAFYWVTVVMGTKTLQFALLESTKKHDLIYDLQSNTSNNPDFEKQMVDYFVTREKRYTHYVRQSVGLFIIKILAAVLLLVVGGLLVFQNQMTIGQLIASELIVTNLLISLFKFSNILDYYYDSAAAIKKLNLLQVESES
jgi:putative ABC transport system ATP-binding protein